MVADRVHAMLGGRYRLDSLVARGGMAEVWAGHDTLLDRPVAVKLPLDHLRSQPGFMARFRREAVAAARLNHPKVVAVYDTGDDAELGAYIVMELVPGPSLRQVIRSEGPLAVDRAVETAAQVAAALEFAHMHGMVHRDVKPANVLLSPDGVKVADFGIAKAALDADDLTQTNMMLGTARYLSPEQVEGRPLDARSDVYALGVVLYEMLCGQSPFDADSDLALAVKHLTVEAAPPSAVNPAVPPWLDEVVMTALAKDPEQRFPSASAVLQSLRAEGRVDGTATRAPAGAAAAAAGAGPADPEGATAGETGLTTLVAGRRPAPPPGGWVPADPTPAGGQPRGPGRNRGRPPAAVIGAGLVAVALGLGAAIVVALADRGPGSDTGNGRPPAAATPPPTQALALAGAHSFNPPPGSGSEHEEVVGNLVDGDPQTYWYTEHYASPSFGNLKSGVGAYVQLRTPGPVGRMVVQSPDSGWTFQVYESSDAQAPGALAGWGAAVGQGTATGTSTTVPLPGRDARWVLLWITNLGDGAASVRVGEITLYA